jgi:signal transduction histidine kinase
MSRQDDEVRGWGWVASWRGLALLWIPIALITLAHYGTGASYHWAHDVLRRLYYIPIVLGAFAFGVRGALATSVVISIVYVPHAFTSVHHQDPAHSVEKLLELLLYNVIAIITGTLADRERRGRLEQEAVARQLAESLEELRLAEEQLVRAGKLRALGELTAGLAHEIKNPLAALKGAVEIVGDEIKPESPRRKMVEILRTEIDRLSLLLERFLSFARPQRLEVADVRLAEIVEPVVGLVEAQAAKAGVRLQWERAGGEVLVRCDRQSISLVLMNVLLNATQALGGRGNVWIRHEREARGRHAWAVLRVEDDGPGVADDLKDKVFDPFFTTKETGSGLGLAIAARVMDENEGTIEVGDRAGGGAVFRILVPLGPQG